MGISTEKFAEFIVFGTEIVALLGANSGEIAV